MQRDILVKKIIYKFNHDVNVDNDNMAGKVGLLAQGINYI